MKFKQILFLSILIINSVLLYILINSPLKTRKFGDGDFHTETKIIAQFIWGETEYDKISVTKAPGPVLYYLLPYVISGKNSDENTNWSYSMIWNAICLSIAIFLLADSAIRLTSNNLAGIITVVITFIIPQHLYYSSGILAESGAFIGCSGVLNGFTRIFKNDKTTSKRGISMLSVGLILLILCRPNAVLVIGILFAITILLLKIKSDLVKPIGFALIITFLVISCTSVLVRNLPNKRQTLTQLDYFSYVAIQGNFQFREEPLDWRFFDKSTKGDSKDMLNFFKLMDELKQKRVKEKKTVTEVNLEWVINDIKNHPFIYARQFFIKILYGHALMFSSVKPENFSLGPLKGENGYNVFYYGINCMNVSLILLALITILKRNKWETMIILSPWIALIVFHACTYMEYRYMFPVRGFIIAFSSIAVFDFIKLKYPYLAKKFSTTSP